MESKVFIYKLDRWDQKVILKVNGFGGKNFTVLLRILSFFGRETIWLLLMVFYLFIWYDSVLFAHIGGTFLLGLAFIVPIKKIFKRSRPFETLKNIKILERKPTSRSFPSWHAYNVISQGLIIGYLLNSIVFTIIIVFFAIIVSFSRIQLGVHYPSDVIVGYLIGIIGFFLVITIIAPLLLEIVRIIEQFSFYEIQYHMINSLLFDNIWYSLLCLGLIGLIIFIAIFKRIKELVKKC